MKLDGLAISGFRSFGPELVYINDLSKINVFIGKNNSGKSNILRFCKHLSTIKVNQHYEGFDKNLDYHYGLTNKDIIFGFQISKDSLATSAIYNQIQEQLSLPNVPFFNAEENCLWLIYSSKSLDPSGIHHPGTDEIARRIMKKFSPQGSEQLLLTTLQKAGGNHENRAEQVAAHVMSKINLDLQVYIVDAFRQITEIRKKAENGSAITSLNGEGLISKLRRLEAPKLALRQESIEKFSKINSFVQELLGESDASLSIPQEEDEIYVSIGEKTLPLDSLGTGIHELIILAAAVSIVDDAVCCIEEPEIHLHPELQKKFIRYIQAKTNNQYLISTHSNAFFDLQDVNLYHCRLVEDCTKCELVTKRHEKSLILSDLGYRASDLLQANYIIWVEGPSDRWYINHWLHNKAPDLKEGLHYSIMFYGGRLLNHLSFDDPEVKEFIQLCRLNRNAGIVIDSDRKSPGEWLNRTKRRVKKDFEDNDMFVWVTSGKEIENYIPEDLWNESVTEVHPKIHKHFKWDQFADVVTLRKYKAKINKIVDKIAVARQVTSKPPDYSILDLDKQITTLIRAIRKANSS